jgi:hypothetical protein
MTYLYSFLTELAELEQLTLAIEPPQPETVVEPNPTQVERPVIEPDCDRRAEFYPTLYL